MNTTPDMPYDHVPGADEPLDDADLRLLDDLRAHWERHDPVPEHLAEASLFALALDDLDTEVELLRMVERSDGLVGARATRSSATHITFTGETTTVLLAVAATDGRRRVDGWVTPAAPVRVVAWTVDGEQTARADAHGRFVLDDVPAGMLRLALHPDPGADGPPVPFVTPTVEL